MTAFQIDETVGALQVLLTQLSADVANIQVVRRLNDAVNARRYDDLDDLFGPTFADAKVPGGVQTVADLKLYLQLAHGSLDFVTTVDRIYPAEGDKVVMHLTFTGRHVGEFFGRPGTGAELSWTSLEIYRLAEGKIIERWVQADTVGLMRQLGLLP